MPTKLKARAMAATTSAPRLGIFDMEKLAIVQLVGTIESLNTLADVVTGFRCQPRLDVPGVGDMWDDFFARIVGERDAALVALAAREAINDDDEQERARALAVDAVTDGRPIIVALEDELERVRAGVPRTLERPIGETDAARASGGAYDLNDLHSEIDHLAGLLDVVVYNLMQGAELGPEARQARDCLHIAADEARRLVDRIEDNFRAIGSTAAR